MQVNGLTIKNINNLLRKLKEDLFLNHCDVIE